MKIKDLFQDERPRERLFKHGAGCLSDVELLAVLLRTGNKKLNAVELARSLLESSNGKVEDLSSMSIDNLIRLNGIGPAKAATLAAGFELGRRCAVGCVNTKLKSIVSPANVYNLMGPHMRDLDHEECWVIYLNRVNHMISKEMMSSGGIDSTVIDCRTIVRKALEKKASGIILVHNHPSGSPRPGVADIEQTHNLKRALSACDISLLDHIIIAKGCYFSFADEDVRT